MLQRVRERAVLVVDVGDAAAHARGEVAPGAARARRRCRRSCIRSRGRRCLRRRPIAPELRTQKRSPATPRKYASPSIAPYITVLPMTMLSSGFAGHAGSGIDDDAAARQSLADVVVGRALQLERDAAREERAEALARDAVERDVDRVVGQARRGRSVRATAPDSIAPTERCALRIRYVEPHRLLLLERRRRARRSAGGRARARARDPAPRSGGARLPAASAAGGRRARNRARCAFQCSMPLAHVEQVGAADHARRSVRKPSFAMISRTSSATKKK